MRVHYRAPLNFTWEGMDESRVALARIDDWACRLEENAKKENAEHRTSNAERRMAEGSGFQDTLDDDLNISGALGVLFETIRETNRQMDGGEMDSSEARAWLKWWERVDRVLAISGEDGGVPAEVGELAEARGQARLAKDWRKSDELRGELGARGWEARDTKDGQKITRRGGA